VSTTDYDTDSVVILTDDQGRHYAIHSVQLQQYRITDDEEGFSARATTFEFATGKGSYRVLGVTHEDSLK
jgi:hypothetical protein